MKSFVRFVQRNIIYTLIEIVGMAVAIAFVLYIGTFLIGQFTSDSFVKKDDNIYIGRSERTYLVSATVKEQMEGRFPEIQGICRIISTSILAGSPFEMQGGLENKKERQNALVADANFFEIFPFPLAEGDLSTVLAAEHSILLSESCASRLFPDGSPVGRTILVSSSGTEIALNVTGVFKDFRNSIFSPPDIIYRTDVFESLAPQMVGNGNGVSTIFYKFADGADIPYMESEMLKVLKENDMIYKHAVFNEFRLVPFRDIATHEIEVPQPFEGIVSMDFISIFIAAGLLLMLFAILNYVSLTVAQTGFRAKEMASRRLVGEQRGGIIMRYLWESFVLTLLSFGLALIFSHTFAPQFSELVGKDVDPLQYTGTAGIIFMVGLVILLSLFAGIIPALMVSRYKPIDVVRGNFSRSSKMVTSKVLVALQSLIAVACISVALIMMFQLRHMINKPMGYERDGRIMVTNAAKASDYHVDELQSLAGVERIGWLQNPPMGMSLTGSTVYRGGQELKLDIFWGDQAAFEILGFKVIQQNMEPYNYTVWLPESVMTALGLGYDCTQIDLDNGAIPVCGIIEDFHKGSVKDDWSSPDFLTVAWIMEMEGESTFNVLNELVVYVSGDEDEAADRIKDFYREKGFSDEDIVVRTYNEVVSELFGLESQNLVMISVLALLVILLASMAMLAMSMYYSTQHAKTAALHKVMGCTRGELYRRTAWGFLKAVVVAAVVACPVAYLIAGKWLENYSYRIDNFWWVYLLAFLAMALVALLSVTWQTVRLINTNPVEALKKE